jgi:hypothetical protein
MFRKQLTRGRDSSGKGSTHDAALLVSEALCWIKNEIFIPVWCDGKSRVQF